MASKRMISLSVIDTDAFLEMPLSTQALYFHLNLRADDDGFVGSPKIITRTVGASEDDLKLLVAKRFILLFEDGVIVIKHWRLHNTLSANRYKETNFIEDKKLLRVKENKAYTFSEEGVPLDDTKLIESSKRQVDKQKTSNRRTKDEQKTNTDKKSQDKSSIDKNSIGESRESVPPTLAQVQAYCLSRNNNIKADLFFEYYEARGWKLNDKPVVSWQALVRAWEKREKEANGFNERNNSNWLKELEEEALREG